MPSLKTIQAGRLFSVWYILHNVAYITIKNPTKVFNGVGADTFISFQPSDLAGADTICLNQHILGNTFFLHSFPKLLIRNQKTSPFLLDILTKYDV